jgi:phospholipase C
VVTYDEHGGFYDHVPPPAAVPPDGEGKYSVPRPAPPDGWTGFWPKLTERFKFARLGVRVPTVIVSPLIPSGVVDHTVYDHTSVLRTVRRSFDISTKLSDREEKANDFSHLFTLETPRPL